MGAFSKFFSKLFTSKAFQEYGQVVGKRDGLVLRELDGVTSFLKNGQLLKQTKRTVTTNPRIYNGDVLTLSNKTSKNYTTGIEQTVQITRNQKGQPVFSYKDQRSLEGSQRILSHDSKYYNPQTGEMTGRTQSKMINGKQYTKEQYKTGNWDVTAYNRNNERIMLVADYPKTPLSPNGEHFMANKYNGNKLWF